MIALTVYETPEVTILNIENDDILTASNDLPDIGLDWS